MKRTQLYLDEQLWEVMKVHARISRSTVSDLVRRALRDKYLSPRRAERLKSMIGLWKDRTDIGDPTEYVRKLRKDRRSERIK
jgi:hypothetical protein